MECCKPIVLCLLLKVCFSLLFTFVLSQPNKDDLLNKYVHEADSRITKHEVVTKDGYVLALYHLESDIQCGKSPKIRVLLLHGLAASCIDFLWNSINQSLGYILNSNCFDVWLGNFRGSDYSQKHLNLSSGDAPYWNCSFDECGRFDVPAMIDFILDYTHSTRLDIIAHSMGATAALITLAQKPEYNNKVAGMVILAPTCNMTYSKHKMINLVDLVEPLKNISGPFPFQGAKLISQVMRQLQGTPPDKINMLLQALNATDTFDDENGMYLDKNNIQHYQENNPQVTLFKCYLHYGQIRNCKQFQMFDYGRDGNLQIYHQLNPPLYQLHQVTVPLIMYSGDNDNTSALEDQNDLARNLPSLIRHTVLPGATHMDFMYCKDPHVCYFPQMMCFLKKSMTNIPNFKYLPNNLSLCK